LVEIFKVVIKVLKDRVLGFYIIILDYYFIKSEYNNVLVSYLIIIRL